MESSHSIPHLLSEVDTTTKAFLDDNSNDVSDQRRKEALRAVNDLSSALNTPQEKIPEHSSTVRNPTYHATDAEYTLPNE